MKVDPAKAEHEEHGGKTYYFCNPGCATKFREAPEKYLQPKEKVAGSSEPAASPKPNGYTCPMHPEVHKDGPGDCPKCGMALEPVTITAPPSRTQYTCPMHPQIVRDEPGNCPICGMALEPMTVTVNEANPELDSMTRRFWIGAALTLPLLTIMVSDLLPSRPIQLQSGDIMATGGLFKMPDGTNPSGQFGVLLRSTDGGRTWDDTTRFFDSPGHTIAAYESHIAELQPSPMIITIGLPFALSAQDAKDDMKEAGHATKNAAKSTGHAAKKAGEGVAEGTEDAAKATGRGVKRTGRAVKHGTKRVVHGAAAGTEKGAEAVKEKTTP